MGKDYYRTHIQGLSEVNTTTHHKPDVSACKRWLYEGLLQES